MPLQPGHRLGRYEIVAPIGAGGMGEVYRATDTELKRSVAIKVLPASMAADGDRLIRFRREAEVLAALNHPNIATIYGIESNALIMELVEGDDLSRLISKGPLSGEHALRLARQIADALEAAHERGIVHRDLKPANIKITPAGGVKVLDFGLAKTGVGVTSNVDLTLDATVTAATQAGSLLGTPAYMSPEQARGQSVDARSDIWAFGGVLYEMLTGRRAFPGDTMSDSLAAVLQREPDWLALPPSTPRQIRTLLRRCLTKDLKGRLHAIADARIELDEVLKGSDADSKMGGVAPTWRARLPWAVAAVSLMGLLVTLGLGLMVKRGSDTTDPGSYNTSIVLPKDVRLLGNPPGRFELSPNGRHIAFVATGEGAARSMLWVRALDADAAQAIAGTEGAAFPFWSPDSRFIAFGAQGKLKRVSAMGGPVQTVCELTMGAGGFSFGSTGAWNADDVILFTPAGGSPIYRVAASGGVAAPATVLDTSVGDAQHWFPFFLPDGRHFLYFAVGTLTGGVTAPRAVHVGSLDSTEPGKPLLDSGSNAKYALGHIFFLRGTTLMAQKFDATSLTLSGEAMPIAEDLQRAGNSSTGAAGAFSVSQTGVIAYQAGTTTVRSQLTWFDRAGKKGATLGDPDDFADVALSPDGSQVAVSLLDAVRNTRNVWIYDTTRGLGSPATTNGDDEFGPAWSADGSRIVYSGRRDGSIDIYQRPANGSGAETLLYRDGLGKFQSNWASDNQSLIYVAGGGTIGRSDLWILPLGGTKKAAPFLEAKTVETHGQFSPDAKWIAYSSGESGRLEVSVTPFPSTGDRVRVSAAGGAWPRWSRDGREVFYLGPDNMLSVASITPKGASVTVGTVRPLFPLHPRPATRLDSYAYDISRDGQRFLVNTLLEDSTVRAISIVINWPAALAGLR